MNKEKDIDDKLERYLSPDLYCYVHNYIVDLKMQITQLTNNWNELEEWLKGGSEGDMKYSGVLYGFTLKAVLDKMKEIKDSDNNE